MSVQLRPIRGANKIETDVPNLILKQHRIVRSDSLADGRSQVVYEQLRLQRKSV